MESLKVASSSKGGISELSEETLELEEGIKFESSFLEGSSSLSSSLSEPCDYRSCCAELEGSEGASKGSGPP